MKKEKRLTITFLTLALVLSLVMSVDDRTVQAVQNVGIPVVSINENGAAIKADGTLWTWGDNLFGQLGDGTTITRTTPVQVGGLKEVVAVSRRGYQTVALKSDGTVWTWGWNYFGQLGNGVSGDNAEVNPIPTKVEGLNNVVAVEAAGSYTIALKADGTVWAWGKNDFGQLGDGTGGKYGDRQLTPVQVNGLEDMVAVTTNGTKAIALKSDGTVWYWGGHNYYGSSVRPTIITHLTPTQVEGLKDVVSVKRLDDSFLVLKIDGTAWVVGWQEPDFGIIPIQVEGLIVDVVKLGNSFVTLKNDGTVWSLAWEGQKSKDTPIQVDELKDIVAIAGGSSHMVALKKDGTVWTWGDNRYGQLGDGTYTSRQTPVQVDSLQDVVAVLAGESHTVSLKADDTVWAWGFNEDSQLGDGTNINRLTPVQITGFHSVPNNKIVLRIGHKEMQFTDYKGDTVTRQMDVAPYIENNYTMIPIRAFEGFGCNIDYDSATKVITISKGGNIVKVQTGSSLAEVNGQEIRMPMSVNNISGRTYLPLRFVSENLNMRVEWYSDTEEILIQNQW